MENRNDNHAETQLFLEVVLDLWLCYDPCLKLLAVSYITAKSGSVLPMQQDSFNLSVIA